MIEALIAGLFTLLAAIVGGTVVYLLNRRKQRLEIKNLQNQADAYAAERDKARLEAQLLAGQVEEQQAQRDKARIELEKLRSETAILQSKELNLRSVEFLRHLSDSDSVFWRTVWSSSGQRLASEVLHNLDTVHASVQAQADHLFKNIGRQLPEQDLRSVLVDIRQANRVIADLTQSTDPIHWKDLPSEKTDTLRAELFSGIQQLEDLRQQLHRLRDQILRSSLQPGMNLSGLLLAHADLHDMDLSRVNFAEAYLWEANLTGANLTAADLTGALLIAADLTGATLHDAILTGARYRKGPGPDATIWPAGFDPDAADAIPIPDTTVPSGDH